MQVRQGAFKSEDAREVEMLRGSKPLLAEPFSPSVIYHLLAWN